MDIDGPARLVVTARHRAKRGGGLVLGIGGIAMTLAGIGVIAEASDLSPTNCDVYGRCQTDATAAASMGLALMLVGAAVTPIGWVLFGKSFHPAIEVQHLQSGTEPAAHLGFVGFPGGAGLSGTFAF